MTKKDNALNKTQISIRLCTAGDIERLERNIPSRGKSKFHEHRLKMQKEGIASYLIAWHDNEPIGHLLIKWKGLGRDLPANLRNIPELNSFVVAENFRGMGVGRLLVKNAEYMSKRRGFKKIGLLVSVRNKKAQLLYENLGYIRPSADIYVDSGEIIDDNGNKYIDNENCYVMIKNIIKNE
jgi:ribosomal protein S18 acetylase RimI-like enzyme